MKIQCVIRGFVLTTLILGILGCSFITLETPFADVHKLGTLIGLGESITIQSANGPIIVEYVAPTKRKIIWRGECREINLRKSATINGIYSDYAKLHPKPIGKVRSVSYEESTTTLKSKEEIERLINDCVPFGWEYMADEQLLVGVEVRSRRGIRDEEMLIIVLKKLRQGQESGKTLKLAEK